jgi:hypothetical protein
MKEVSWWVEHGSMKKQFSFSNESADKAYYSAFYADCDQTLRPVTKGYRLVLAFNLVRLSNMDTPLPVSFGADRVVDDVRAAVKDWTNDPSRPLKAALPLLFKYNEINLSFDGLKSADLELANRIRSFTDEKGARLFRLHLAMVTKHETGPLNDEEYDRYHRGGRGSYRYSMLEVQDTDYFTKLCVSEEGKRNTSRELGGMKVSFPKEILNGTSDVFGDSPDKEECEGSHDGNVEYWYHKALVVFWPMICDFDIAFDNNPAAAISLIELSKPTPYSTAEAIDDYSLKLRSVILCLTKKPQKLFPGDQSLTQRNSYHHSSYRRREEPDPTATTMLISRLLSLCLLEEEVISMLKIVNRKQIAKLNPELIRILALIQKRFHLNAFRDSFFDLINEEKSIVNVISFIDSLVKRSEQHHDTRPSALDDLEAAMFERIMALSIPSIDQAICDAVLGYFLSHDKIDWMESFAASFLSKSSINDQAWICSSISAAHHHAAHPSSIAYIVILKNMVVDMLTRRDIRNMKSEPFKLYLRFLASFDDDGHACAAFLQSCIAQFTVASQPWLYAAIYAIASSDVESKFLPSLQELLVNLVSSSKLSLVREEQVFRDVLLFYNRVSIGDDTRAIFLVKAKDEMSLAQQPWIINCIHSIQDKNLVYYSGLQEVGVALILANNNFSAMSGNQLYACYKYLSTSSRNSSADIHVFLSKLLISDVAFNVIVDFIVQIEQLLDDSIPGFHQLLILAVTGTDPALLMANHMIRLLVWLAEKSDCKMKGTMTVTVHIIEKNWNLVTAILDDPGIRQAIQRGNLDLIELCKRRIENLSTSAKAVPPPFTWSIPDAKHENSTIHTFLRGPTQTLTISNQFSGIVDARKFVSQLTKSDWSAYFNAEAGGSGRKAFITVTKTGSHYDNLATSSTKEMQKMKELQGLLAGKRLRDDDLSQQDKRYRLGTSSSSSATR